MRTGGGIRHSGEEYASMRKSATIVYEKESWMKKERKNLINIAISQKKKKKTVTQEEKCGVSVSW